ncbi:fimbria/pilus outer membrane usher protein [Kerstersia gyiorum]|uniref:fimbria/pilus outer membrane usher protein n=1 Tax=Kerstersia gyiorum TaxID=206506 RepID=UPI003B43CE6D
MRKQMRLAWPGRLVAPVRSVKPYIFGCLLAPWAVHASPDPAPALASVQFDSAFLHRTDNAQVVDLSVFAFANRVLPGLHVVKLELNGRMLGQREIFFREAPGKDDAQACITKSLLEELGFAVLAFPELVAAAADSCVDLDTLLPDASQAYQVESNILALSIPQAALPREPRGYVSPSLWDSGENALWASYRMTYQHGRTKGDWGHDTYNSSFTTVRSGLNLGTWRVRALMNYYHSNGEGHFDFSEVYGERDITDWTARIRLGDSVSPSSAFGSTRFRGVQVFSDEGMRPDSMRGYAPTVHGMASTNARVTIRQNGYVVYTTFVPPGPFVISDLYSTVGGGDLEVEVEEADGQVSRFIQPFASLPAMVREGVWNYNFLAGEYRQGYNNEDHPWMAQATFGYGLMDGLTVYGGWSSAKRYNAGSMGLAFNLKEMGAVSADFTHSRSDVLRQQRQSGNAVRLQYAKVVPGVGTDIRMVGYRYTSSGYRSLNDAMQEKTSWHPDFYYGARRSQEYQLSIGQNLGRYGNLNLNIFRTSFHNLSGNSTTFRLGYGGAYRNIAYYLSYDVQKDPWQQRNNQVMLQLTIPFGNGMHSAGYAISHHTGSGVQQQATLNGVLTEDFSTTYSLRAGLGRDDGHTRHDGYGSLSYSGPVGAATISHGYSHYSNTSQIELSGALLADSKGLILGQQINDTAVIVDANGAAGVAVENYPGVKTNEAGRALLPYATPYRENRISLAPGYRSENVALQQNVKTVVPTYGAVVVAEFETEEGRTALVSLQTGAGIVPFGAMLLRPDGEQVGIVGPSGRAWLTGLRESSSFTAKWGNDEDQMCRFLIDLDDTQPVNALKPKELLCE